MGHAIENLMGKRVEYLAASGFHVPHDQITDGERGTIGPSPQSSPYFSVTWESGYQYDLYRTGDFKSGILKLGSESWMVTWLQKGDTS